MRPVTLVLLPALLLNIDAHTQSSKAAVFAAEVAARYASLATVHSVTLNGTAEWTAGSLHETGPATLKASNDGSSSLQLSLSMASRTETRNALGSSRTCEWTDAKGAVHPLAGPDCDSAVPWFAPILLLQPISAIASGLNITDDGEVLKSSSTYRQLSYRSIEPTKS